MMRRRSGFGWLELAVGILMIGLGILAFARPNWILTGLVAACGIAALVMGIADIIFYIQIERYTGLGPVLSLVAGILSVMSGVMLLVHRSAGILVLTILFPMWFIAHCISRLAHLDHIRLVAGRGMYFFSLTINIIGLVLGLMMLLSPLFTLTALRCFASLYLILLGIDSIATAVSRLGMRN